MPIRIWKGSPKRRWTASPYPARSVWIARAAWSARIALVLVGDRRAEEGHDAVARELIDRALVAMHGAGEELEAAVHDRVDDLGIEALRQRAEPHDIGEEHRDLLALALEGSLGREDLLGEMPWRISVRRGEAWGGRVGRRQRLSAAPAELPPEWNGGAAGRAAQFELGAALLAEANGLAILEPALGAAHQASSRISPSACSSQNRMSISRYIVVAVVR
jgi:hypothetical protein